MAQEFRSLRASAQSIGFHELRQALEISSLKQDLERVARDTGDLRAHIEEAVEQVRGQFAALTPEELSDASRMAPLLQSAVKSLLGIRDAARRIEVNSGPVADADRPDPPPLSLLHTARPEPVNLDPVTPPDRPTDLPPAPAIFAPPPTPAPARAPGVAAPPSAPSLTDISPASWINPTSGPPAPPASAPPRPARGTASVQSVDWLGPPRR
ncbi:hypothetical protein [Azospirillum sp. sgz301742]